MFDITIFTIRIAHTANNKPVTLQPGVHHIAEIMPLVLDEYHLQMKQTPSPFRVAKHVICAAGETLLRN